MADDPIDLVLVTGAGASCDFGVNYTKLPLMAEWSTLVLRKLREVPGFADAVGLVDGMTGPEFEDRLGAFLQAFDALRRVEPLLEPLGRMLQANAPSTMGNPNNTWEAWHGQAVFQVEQAVGRIYESLYESFGSPNVDHVHVRNAYASLLTHLGIDEESTWVYATTNYDVIADTALESLGFSFDDGTVSPRFANVAERQFRVPGLLRVIDRDVPLLHLHGRVGWLVRSDPGRQGAYAVDGLTNWTSSFGTPLVMLPDPAKRPGSVGVISEMWVEFAHALQRARRVLVLGHSLHDEALIDALAEPAAANKVGVTMLGDPETRKLEADGPQVAELVGQRLPNAHHISLRFGRDYGPDIPLSLKAWLDATASNLRR